MTVHDLPAVNATLNALSGILLLVGYVLIRGRRTHEHRVVMLAAFATSAVFLICYIVCVTKIVSATGVATGPTSWLYCSVRSAQVGEEKLTIINHLSRLIALVAVLLASVVVEPVLAQTGRVGGRVQDESGDPIRGATISARNNNIGARFTATTDEKGRFSIVGLSVGTWQFMAAAPGFEPQGGEMPVSTMAARNAAMIFTLERIPGEVGILGNVSAEDLQAALSAADALFNEGQWDKAIAAYRALLDDTPSLTVVNLQIGAALRGKGDFPGAVAAYNDFLAENSDSGLARIGIAMAHLEAGNAAAAEAALLPVVQAPDARPDVLYTFGEVKTAQGLAADAVQWYQRSSDADPAWGKPRYKLAQAALDRGDTQAASEFLAQVIAVDPISVEAALAKGDLERLSR